MRLSVPRRGIQTTPSLNLTLFTAGNTGGVISELVCTALAVLFIHSDRFLGNRSWDRHPDLCSFSVIRLWFEEPGSRAGLPNPKCSAPALKPGEESFLTHRRLNRRRRGVSAWGRTGPERTGQEVRSQYSLPLAYGLITNILGKSHAYLSVPSIFSSIK